MKDEIKEILDVLNRMAKENKESDNPLQATVILYEILYKVLDYITNLKEENRQTKLLKERYQLEKEDYKSRNEKAIEYIKSFYETPEYIDAYDITYWTDKVMKILNGGDDNE